MIPHASAKADVTLARGDGELKYVALRLPTTVLPMRRRRERECYPTRYEPGRAVLVIPTRYEPGGGGSAAFYGLPGWVDHRWVDRIGNIRMSFGLPPSSR